MLSRPMRLAAHRGPDYFARRSAMLRASSWRERLMSRLALPLAYNSLDETMRVAEHAVIAQVFATPLYARTPHIGALWSRRASQDLARMAWACRIMGVPASPWPSTA